MNPSESRLRWCVGLALGLSVNSLYLAVRRDPTALYFANVVLHPLLGVALAWLAWGSRRAWLSSTVIGPSWARWLTWIGVWTLGTGLLLLFTGATRPWRWALWLHVISASVAALAVSAFVMRVRLRFSAIAVLAGLFAALAPGARWVTERFPEQQLIVNPSLPPSSMDGEGAGKGHTFFPSSSETNVGGTIPATFFMTSKDCGRCHKDIYDQWNSSAHHMSSFNNQWYRKSIEYMQDVVGTEPSKWCAGCHDHAVFFNGRFDKPIRDQIETPEAQNGLGCTSCHSVVHVKSTMGQGDFTIEYPPLHDLAVSENPLLRTAHDYLLKLDPGPHAQTFLKSFHKDQTAEFCSSCHKVHLDAPVNAYRWFRGFNEYDNWQASGVSGQGARSFYYPPEPKDCGDCHMPLVASDDPAAREGKVHSHRFPGANTALPHVNGDAEQLAITQAFLRAGQVSIDVFGIVRGKPKEQAGERRIGEGPRLSSTFAVGEESLAMGASSAVLTPASEVIGPLGAVDVAVRRGESVRLEVVLRTRGVGHFFPGGTVDAFDVWVELEAVDENGRSILHSGGVADDGRGSVDPSAHFYKSLMLDEHGNPIDKRNAWAARSVAYVRLIPPGAADTIHYRVDIPEDCGDTITLRAKVNYRKFAWWNTQWSYAGVRDPKHEGYSVGDGHDDGRWVFEGDTSTVSGPMKEIPNLPITVMAENEAVLKVVDADLELPPREPYLDPSVRERWNDYGIGLLLQGDLKSAEAAFLKVTQMEPEYADGWVNVARARINEGASAAAEEVLRRALEVDPDLAKTHFFMALALKARGEYDAALGHLRSAAAQYPRDRVVRNQMGRLLFLKREFAAAVEEFRQVLTIDPENLQAHYNLMLCYQGLGETDKKERHETLYKRFKADESAQFITGPYRKLHPYDNNERQSVHEHGSGPPEGEYLSATIAYRTADGAAAGASR